MIDLTELKPTCDIAIGIASISLKNRFTVTFSSEPQQELVDAIYMLESKGMFVFHLNILRRSLIYEISTGNYDCFQVAEKLALYFESKNLKVHRLVSKPESVDKTPCMLVESFILAAN